MHIERYMFCGMDNLTKSISLQNFVESYVGYGNQDYWLGLRNDFNINLKSAKSVTPAPEKQWRWVDGSSPGPDTDGIRWVY